VEKLTYKRPELRFLGDLQELTAGKKGTRADKHNNTKKGKGNPGGGGGMSMGGGNGMSMGMGMM
jgi:hypothetical protein